MQLTFPVLLKCFGRTYLVGANFNTRGLQNIGLAFAMDPGLQAIHRTEQALQEARRRYVRLYNTHPYFTPLLVGAFLFLEKNIAQGLIPASSLDSFQNTATYTLSAVGDSFFGGSMLVLWSLSTALILVSGWITAAWAWLILWFLGLHVFKGVTFWLGLTRGLSFLQQLRQMDLMYWGQRIKLINTGLVLALWLLIFPFPWHSMWFGAASAVLGGVAWMVYRGFLRREAIAALCIAGWMVWAWFESMG